MKHISLHRDLGICINEDITDETVYLDTLEQAAIDAEIVLAWLEPDIVRIFPLQDGRIAVVRESATGLRQEAASSTIQDWFETIAAVADVLVTQQAARQLIATESNSEND